jgi:signal transduction histidine kinase
MVNTIMMLLGHQLDMAMVHSEVVLPDPPFTAWGDYALIQQCLMNLLFNSMEATPGGGKITITGERLPGGKKVCLSVADTGQGIKDEDLPQIFEPFFSTKETGKGVGLGLSMVYGIVREHNGAIEVDSRPGEGSVFRLILPVSAGT